MSEAHRTIDEYNQKRRQQLSAIDEEQMESHSDLEHIERLRIIKKYPILSQWNETLVQINRNLLKTVEDIERNLHADQSDSIDSDTSFTAEHENGEGDRVGKRGNTDEKPAIIIQARNRYKHYDDSSYGNQRPLRYSCPSNEPKNQIKDTHNGCQAKVKQQTLATSLMAKSKSVLSNLLRRKDKRSRREVSQPDTVEFVYMDNNVCCVSAVVNDKVVNVHSTDQRSHYTDFKNTCSEQFGLLKGVARVFKVSVKEKERQLQEQSLEICHLKEQLARYKEVHHENSRLKNELETMAIENVSISLELKTLRRSLRNLCKRSNVSND